MDVYMVLHLVLTLGVGRGLQAEADNIYLVVIRGVLETKEGNLSHLWQCIAQQIVYQMVKSSTISIKKISVTTMSVIAYQSYVQDVDNEQK